jgi:hypothetical protein
MRNAPTYIALLLALMTASCVMSGKPKATVPVAPIATARPPAPPAPAPAPPALSIPQTQVELPRPQTVDEAALSPYTPPPPVEVVEPPPPSRAPPTRRTPANTTTTPAPPAAAPAEPAPPPIQEIIPQAEVKRLEAQAQSRRRDVQQIVEQLLRRQLNPAQRGVITNIQSFLDSSLDAEKRGDMKLADALADRAQILARDLVNGK